MRQVPNASTKFSYIFPFFIVIILDAMGSGIILPILAPLLSQNNQHWFSGSDFIQHIIYGLVLAVFPFCYMLGAPLLGALSDLYGRKKVLLICLLGTLAGFILYACSFKWDSLLLLILGRVVAGFTSGSQGVAQAAMADISQGKDRAANFGIIAVALTIGLVAGPLIGGVLSNSQWVSWFNQRTPFYAAVILAVINLIFLLFTVQDHYPAQDIQKQKWFNQSILQLKSFFINKELAKLLLAFFFFELGWSLYYQAQALLLVQLFHYSNSGIGLFLGYIGVILSLSLAILVRWICPRFSFKSIILMTLLIGVVSLLLLFCLDKIYWQYLLALAVTAVVALVYTSMITLASEKVSIHHQGLLMGTTDSLLALAFSLTGFLSGWLAYYSVQLPFFIAAIFWIISFFFAIKITKE